MDIYITRINGLSLWNPLQYRQYMIAEIAHQLGCREMGIYRYPADIESAERRSSRLDGIIAGINAGDIVICQFPTDNGLKFERELVNHLKAYQGRVAVFIHDVNALINKDNWSLLQDTIDLYNQAELLIVPSYAMRQFLVENGVRKEMKFIVQEMWDYIVNMPFLKNPEFRKEIHYADRDGFEGMKNWNYGVPLKNYGNPDESFPELSKGGFGLVWYQDMEYRQYMEYNISFSLSRYLAAGIPVIVPAGISNQALIEENHLGIVVNSLDEATASVEAMNESEYQEYVRCVGSFSPALRAGYYTKKCLVGAIQAFYRKDAGKISIPQVSYSLGNYEFVSAIQRESYNGSAAISWSFKGEPDGFLICDISGTVIHDTRNVHQHYFLIKEHRREEDYIIKAYVDTLRGKLVVAESKAAHQNIEQFQHPKVSLVIPAYNAEDHIVRSVDTALAQSFLNLEIIIVDDGSTDHTPEIIDWYAEKYPNVIAIHQKNGSAPAARNTGIKHVQGEYIGFLDSDDMLHPDMIASLFDSIKKNDCDVAVTSAYWVEDGEYRAFIQYAVKEDTAVTFDVFFDMHYIKECGYGVVIWNKLYRTSLVKERLFPLIKAEDEAWTPYVLSYADKICYLDDRSYEYDRTSHNPTLSVRVGNRSKEEVFSSYRDTVMFYLKNGNQRRIKLLKKLAKIRLLDRERAYAYEEYGNLWKKIDETF